MEQPVKQLRPAVGSRIGINQFGFYVEGNAPAASYPHPFKPALQVGIGAAVKISRGLILSLKNIEPKINGVPISGDTKNAQPALKLDAKNLNTGTLASWVCVEAEPNADGVLDEHSRVEIVHEFSQPLVLTGKFGRAPLAMILWSAAKMPFRAFEIAYFNLRYVHVVPAPGAGP